MVISKFKKKPSFKKLCKKKNEKKIVKVLTNVAGTTGNPHAKV